MMQCLLLFLIVSASLWHVCVFLAVNRLATVDRDISLGTRISDLQRFGAPHASVSDLQCSGAPHPSVSICIEVLSLQRCIISDVFDSPMIALTSYANMTSLDLRLQFCCRSNLVSFL